MPVTTRRRSYTIWQRDLKAALRESRGAANSFEEVCGLLVDVGPAVRLRPTKNIARRQGSFTIGLREIRSVLRAADMIDVEVVGTYHSHFFGEPEPGSRDIEQAPNGSLMLILQAFRRTAGLWWIENGKARRVRFVTL